jgi:hypothetical protein
LLPGLSRSAGLSCRPHHLFFEPKKKEMEAKNSGGGFVHLGGGETRKGAHICSITSTRTQRGRAGLAAPQQQHKRQSSITRFSRVVDAKQTNKRRRSVKE